MKKYITIFMLLIGGFIVQAQVNSENAIGLRLGENDGFGVEVSYQLRVAEMNRLEFDLGWRDSSSYDAWKLSALYQWVWHIDGGFNWYAGFGAGIGSWSAESHHNNADDDGLFINADGNVGIEYVFDIPLLLSLDFRPEFEVAGNFGDSTSFDIALGVRYLF